MKKEYVAPSMESLKIQEPLAYACTIYNAESSVGGCWSGSGVSNPVFSCDGPSPGVCR